MSDAHPPDPGKDAHGTIEQGVEPMEVDNVEIAGLDTQIHPSGHQAEPTPESKGIEQSGIVCYLMCSIECNLVT